MKKLLFLVCVLLLTRMGWANPFRIYAPRIW